MGIREYTDNDFEELRSLVVELQNYMQNLEPEILDTGENIADEFLTNLLRDTKEKPGVIYIAEEKGHLVGFVSGRKECGGDDIELVEKKYFYVSNLSVLPKYRGKGIGKNLLTKIEEYAKQSGFKNLILNVLTKNSNAYSLYHKFGFRELEKVMHKTLNI